MRKCPCKNVVHLCKYRSLHLRVAVCACVCVVSLPGMWSSSSSEYSRAHGEQKRGMYPGNQVTLSILLCKVRLEWPATFHPGFRASSVSWFTCSLHALLPLSTLSSSPLSPSLTFTLWNPQVKYATAAASRTHWATDGVDMARFHYVLFPI